eukprot:TRINITY_DN131541_c1_g1_i1.p1 TRINITY_DN131541_c1_g1~~TRINITY_DN131541_c1_g1_i1.p1  ORF type:complete len:165 (+),score=28.96 TRINITY_DN131541_c1_g1_i1:2-496(+)
MLGVGATSLPVSLPEPYFCSWLAHEMRTNTNLDSRWHITCSGDPYFDSFFSVNSFSSTKVDVMLGCQVPDTLTFCPVSLDVKSHSSRYDRKKLNEDVAASMVNGVQNLYAAKLMMENPFSVVGFGGSDKLFIGKLSFDTHERINLEWITFDVLFQLINKFLFFF